VYVVWHQAVSENADAGLPAVLSEQIEIDAAVSLGVEDDLAVGSALGDVIGSFGQDEPS
jgi:hypothetical protein